MLSDGEKCLLSLVGDLASRLAIADPIADNPLEGSGIVLVDEIDLHLHPAWQRKVTHILTRTFPNCQFIVTTHSPQVLGEIKAQDIRQLNDFKVSVPSQSYGLDSNSILDSIQNTDIRNASVTQKIDAINGMIDEGKFDEAHSHLLLLEKELCGSTNDTVSLGTEIALMEA